MALTAILLAAGRGRRFDPDGARNKLLQRLPHGECVVAASARTLLAVFPRVVAVVPPADGGVREALQLLGCEVTTCPDADGGMGLSLAHAIRYSLRDHDPDHDPDHDHAHAHAHAHEREHEHEHEHEHDHDHDHDHDPGQGWLVALGDMPFVDQATLRALASAIEDGAGIAAPLFEGRRGNPVAFGALHRAALLALDGDQGARRLLERAPVTAIAVDDPGILRDIDSPADLA